MDLAQHAGHYLDAEVAEHLRLGRPGPNTIRRAEEVHKEQLAQFAKTSLGLRLKQIGRLKSKNMGAIAPEKMALRKILIILGPPGSVRSECH